jgi:4-alpha-glucanotransferase
LLKAAMRHSGAIRIDHVLGLMRLFVIPSGSGPRDGVYLRFPFETLLDVVADESRRNECIVIGEDLGTVPEGFRATMHRWGLWSCLVMMFEREWDGSFRPPQSYPENAVASFGTHDLPTFAGWMEGYDLTTKRAIDVNPGESDEDRERAHGALRQAVGGDGSVLEMVQFLAATPSRLVSVALEDVLAVRDQINVPGTIRQHPNWRRRLPVAVEDLGSDPRLREVGAVFDRAGRGKG